MMAPPTAPSSGRVKSRFSRLASTIRSSDVEIRVDSAMRQTLPSHNGGLGQVQPVMNPAHGWARVAGAEDRMTCTAFPPRSKKRPLPVSKEPRRAGHCESDRN